MSLPPPSLNAQCVPTPSPRPPKRPEVYVLVPSSPYSPYAPETIGLRSANESHHNPPTPLRAHNMPITESPLVTIKRKPSKENFATINHPPPQTKSNTPKDT